MAQEELSEAEAENKKMAEPNNMLNEMEFEAQLSKLSGDELNRFVARQMYATTQRCVICVRTIEELNQKIGAFDSEEKGSLDKRLAVIETRDRRHLQISTAAGAGGGMGLSFLFQAIWTAITKH